MFQRKVMLPFSGYNNKMEAEGSSETVAVPMMTYASENWTIDLMSDKKKTRVG
jgi:hypothetical protein